MTEEQIKRNTDNLAEMLLLKDYGYKNKIATLPTELEDELRQMVIGGYSSRKVKSELEYLVRSNRINYPNISIPSHTVINNYRNNLLTQDSAVIISGNPYFFRKIKIVYEKQEFDSLKSLIAICQEAMKRYQELGRDYEETTKMPLRARHKALKFALEATKTLIDFEIKLGIRRSC
ncbi:hypothetical protein HYV44_01685 [Candidatus Microgenomates bacterium]|nr:hypothetical protein [Candidatus Microgenomates bacterium]